MQSIPLSTHELNLPLVWDKAQYIDAWHELRGYRKDHAGNLICFFAYNIANHPYGWGVEHIMRGGSDDIENLIPVHTKPANIPAPQKKDINPFTEALAQAGLGGRSL